MTILETFERDSAPRYRPIREVARLMPDQQIARLLNRAGKPTGRGNGWTQVERPDPQARPARSVTAPSAAPGTELRAALYRESGLVLWH
jgi:hypothetical protein